MTQEEQDRAVRFVEKLNKDLKEVLDRYTTAIQNQKGLSQQAKSFAMNTVLNYHRDMVEDAKSQTLRVMEGTIFDDEIPF